MEVLLEVRRNIEVIKSWQYQNIEELGPDPRDIFNNFMFVASGWRNAYFVLRSLRQLRMINMSSSPAIVDLKPPPSSDALKRKEDHRQWFKSHKRRKVNQNEEKNPVQDISNEDVLSADIRALLANYPTVQEFPEAHANDEIKKETPSVSELEVSELSSTGDGLAYDEVSGHVCVIPFAIPGDKVRAKVFKKFNQHRYALADFVEIINPSPNRDDSLIKCQYFAKCGGCQFQMMSYEKQLEHKRRVVEKAFKNFSSLSSSEVPQIGETIGSPKEYEYRTKLTPHFDGPPGGRRERRNGRKPKWEEVPPIGFMKKNTRQTLDIEDCPIGTNAVRIGLKQERARIARDIQQYQRGATILSRESTTRTSCDGDRGTQATDDHGKPNHIVEKVGNWIYDRTFITSQTAASTEYVDDFIFENAAGTFFQNNNSILPTFISYILEHILPPDNDKRDKPISNLIDAYCGSGLFTITLSSLFKRSIGIDIADSSIKYAKRNAELNKLPESQAQFISADAANIFGSVQDLPADETVVVIDPPRKGCDETFLNLLLKYRPERIVYVSCNVHTQARDVGMLVRGKVGPQEDGLREGPYEIESLRGFDFFPQTGHVEGVAVLRKRSPGHTVS